MGMRVVELLRINNKILAQYSEILLRSLKPCQVIYFCRIISCLKLLGLSEYLFIVFQLANEGNTTKTDFQSSIQDLIKAFTAVSYFN